MTKIVEEIEAEQERGGIIAFRATADLIGRVETAAAVEGISKSDVARRAVIRDLARDGVSA
jgi:hypothetical protein